jgi:hypothetical protein
MGPYVYSLLETPPEVWDFRSTFLMQPRTAEGYQAAIRVIRGALAQRQSERSRNILYNQLMLLEHWKDPIQPPPQQKRGRPPTYDNREEFVGHVQQVSQQILRERRYKTAISKPAIAKEMGTSYRTLRRWEVKFQVDVKQVLSAVIQSKKT